MDDKFNWYYRQIDENEKNIQKNLNHIANREPKEKPRFIVPENERYRNNIRVCKIPEIYENFKIKSENDFVITFQHLYTMQCSEEAGFYNSNSKWIHYHSLGKELLYNLPQLLENPEIVLCSSSKEDIINNDIDNTTLACVLNQNVTLSVDGKKEDCPVVAMIKPNITDDKATVILTAYPKQDFERFLQKGIEQNRLLYLKNKEALRRDYPVVETIRVATVPFNELLYKDNIANFKENVNLKRVENNGMALQTIPDEEKTIKVCNAAKRENPASVIFFPERQRSVKLYTEVFETLDKTAIQNIPEDYFIKSLKNYLQSSMTKKYNSQPKMAFSAINKRITNTQRELIKQTIRSEYELYDDSEEIADDLIISEFKDWSENPSPIIQKQILPAQKGENTMSNEEIKIDEGKLSPVEYLMLKVNGSGVKVHLSKDEMKSILDTGKNVQKMAVKYGTNQNIEDDKDFSGYGTYVVSVNEENAKLLGIKIASRKYGGTFYINNRPLSEFLQEQNFSPYWNRQLELLKGTSIDELTAQILRADVKGNANLINEQNKLSTVLGLGLVEYKREQTFLYSVNIPDNDNTNYLFYDKSIGLEHANKINEQLEKLGVEWRVSRNDSGKNVYFNVLSQKVFENNQKQSSEFLKSIGYVGMEMSGNNYIVFNDKDMDITNRVQYMKDKNGEVYGFVYEGEIYADEELVNSNVLAHEYTHIWDTYVQNNNPELWQKGKNILKGTSLWQSVVEDKNYENLTTDDEILSECHSRLVGEMAEKILENIAKRDGGFTRDQVIDWDKEVEEYIVNELRIKPELGTENYISDSVKAEYLKEFLSQPMKDLMSEINISQNNIQSEQILKQIKSELSNEDLEYIHSSDFIEKFGDWEKVNRLENSQKIILPKENEETKIDIGENGTIIPEVAFITQNGLKLYKDMRISGYDKESGSYTLSHFAKEKIIVKDENGNLTEKETVIADEKIIVPEKTINELVSDQRKNVVSQFNGETLKRDKMLLTQYEDYFKPREPNTANNFRHNLEVWCRKKANNPCDALKIAKILIQEMSETEKEKTRLYLDKMSSGTRNYNPAIIDIYHDAKKAVPLNEEFIKYKLHDKIIARPMYDEISGKGEKIDRAFNIKIGDSVKMNFKTDSLYYTEFSKKEKFITSKENLLENCKIISASKEGNCVTLMNEKQAVYTVPRDEFLKNYAKQQKQIKNVEKQERKKAVSISW